MHVHAISHLWGFEEPEDADEANDTSEAAIHEPKTENPQKCSLRWPKLFGCLSLNLPLDLGGSSSLGFRLVVVKLGVFLLRGLACGHREVPREIGASEQLLVQGEEE